MHPGKTLIILGILMILAGILITWGGKITLLGRLPGDLRIERDHFTFYFPLGTSILISIVLSVLFWMFRR